MSFCFKHLQPARKTLFPNVARSFIAFSKNALMLDTKRLTLLDSQRVSRRGGKATRSPLIESGSNHERL
jgi:hypothetical protein